MRFIIATIAILIMAAILCTGCTNQLTNNNPSGAPVQTPGPVSTTPGSSILKYEDKELRVSFNYPDSYNVTKNGTSIEIRGIDFDVKGGYNFIDIGVQSTSLDLDHATKVFKRMIQTSGDPLLMASTMDSTNASIGGLNAKSVVVIPSDGPPYHWYIVVHNNNVYILSYFQLTEKNKGIINSIQFL